MTAKIPRRLAWAVETLDVQPDDRILEIGCGPGVAAALVCEKLTGGTITAIDRSAKAIALATGRNEGCIASGRARFYSAALSDVSLAGERFNKIFAVNVNIFWLKPSRELAALKPLLASHGILYLFYEPPTASKAAEIADKVRGNLESSGFAVDRVLSNEPLVCIMASLTLP